MSLQEWAGAQRVTIALLFTDIVGSTRLANRMGDEKWIDVIINHAQKGRYLMNAFDCYEIKMIGDAFMIAFRTADDAIDFAFQFHGDTGHEAIRMRAGIHVGSVYIVDDDLYGKTVNYAARIVKAVPDDWIVLSEAAKNDLDIRRARDKHDAIIRITELGANLKGFPPPNRIWRALTQQIDKTEKARLAPSVKVPDVPVRPRLNLSPPPNRDDRAQRLSSFGITRPRNATAEDKAQPDWWMRSLEKPVEPDKAENFLRALLQPVAKKDG
jgi:class 3 adenylate cyclase